MNRSMFLAALAGVAMTGCLLGPVDDIPCSVDTECPDEAFCDLEHSVCVDITENTGIPDLEITALETPDGKKSLSAAVERETLTRVLMHIENRGLSPAESIEIEFSEYHAIDIVVEEGAIPESIDGKQTKRVAIDVLIDADSSTPVPVDWFLRFSGRERRGIFNFAPPRPGS